MKPLLALNPLLRSLRDRHQVTQDKIDSEQARPMPDSMKLAALKKLKLNLRDKIEFLQGGRRGSEPVMVVRRRTTRRFADARG